MGAAAGDEGNGRTRNARKYAQVVAKAWIDDAFKAEPLAEPKRVLEEHGVEIPQDLDIRINENSSTRAYISLPARPTELDDHDLARVAGGSCNIGDVFTYTCW